VSVIVYYYYYYYNYYYYEITPSMRSYHKSTVNTTAAEVWRIF